MRWKETDKILKLNQPKIKSLYRWIEDEILDIYKTYEITPKKVTPKTKRTLDNLILELKEKGLYRDFFSAYVDSAPKKTEEDVVFLIIYCKYMLSTERLEKIEKDIFMTTAIDSYNRVKKDVPNIKSNVPTWESITPFLFINNQGVSLSTYLILLYYTNTKEIKSFIALSQVASSLNESALDKLIDKQRKRLLNINDDKFSGVLHDLSIKVGNDVYIEPLREENHKVIFKAIMDNRTTDMCISLNGLIFNTNGKNSFDRYSASTGGIVHYEVEGLIDGLNLPPIEDSVHHCRSWIEVI